MAHVFRLVALGADLIVAGDFQQAGQVEVKNIARWDGLSYRPLDTGLDGPVHALVVHDGELIAGGVFTKAGEQSVENVARWDGHAWSPLGSGMNGAVTSLAVHEGELFAGGSFTGSGGRSIQSIARWDGSTWHPLGTGLTRSGEEYGFHSRVMALISLGEDLVATGSFERAGNEPLQNIARWNGSTWTPLGSGLTGYGGEDLAIHSGELIVTGSFSEAGGTRANGIARWNGTRWNPLGTGLSGSGYGNALAVHAGELYVGGLFSRAAGDSPANVARWDGSSWDALTSGLDRWVHALASFQGELYVGGGFSTAGARSASSITSWSSVVASASSGDGARPALALEKNHPNPVLGETVFHYALPAEAGVRFSVLDLQGREVATLLHGMQSAGSHVLRWNGRDAQGRRLPSGVYLYRLETVGESQSGRLLLLD